jgi:tetratricopeptide (TPR) repeat protein
MQSGFEAGTVVNTPYGECTVTSVREGSDEVTRKVLCTPTKWQLADYSSSQPRFYLSPKDVVKRLLSPGDAIISTYGGKGKIVETRPLHYVVTLNNWIMADGKSPMCYLQHNAVKLDTIEQEKETEKKLKLAKCRDLLDLTVNCKETAAILFKKKDYDGAKKSYLEALGTLNKMGTELSDSLRAEVLEHTIPCHNNVALCSMKLKQYEDAITYANNGVLLVDAIDNQICSGAGAIHGGKTGNDRKLSLVWLAFKKRNMSYTKLIKDWKKKSLFYKGKAYYLAKDYDNAIDDLALALAVLNTPIEGSVGWALAHCDGNNDAVDKLIDHDLYLSTTTNSDGTTTIGKPNKVKVEHSPEQQKQIKEILDLLQKAKNEKKISEKKEKQTWSRAFAKTADSEPMPEYEAKPQPPAIQMPLPTPAPVVQSSAPLPISVPSSGTNSKIDVDVSKFITPKPASPRSVSETNSSKVISKPSTDEEEEDDEEEEESDDEDDDEVYKDDGGVFGGYGAAAIGVTAAAALIGGFLFARKK